MRAKTTPLSALVFGVTYIGCGLIQVAAGIFFLLVPTVLRTGSNAWTGLLTILSGCLLLNVSRQKAKAKIKLGIHTGVLLTNLCNLLLTELGEWRAFLASDPLKEFIRQGHVTILLIAYFSTAVPTVIAFVVSFLATQYSCCIFITGKTSEDLNKEQTWNGSSIRSSISYDWVFQDKDQENIENHTTYIALQDFISEKSFPLDTLDHCELGSSMGDHGPAVTACSDDGTFNLRTFSNAFCNVPATFHPCNWSPAMDVTTRLQESALPQTVTTQLGKDFHGNLAYNIETSMIEVQTNDGDQSQQSLCFYSSLNPNYGVSKLSSSNMDTDWLPSRSRSGNDVSNNKESSTVVPKVPTVLPIREVQCRQQVSKQVAYSSEMPRTEWCLPSRPLVSMDNDSLIYLKHLELLARQWRVDHEHKQLHNTIAKRMSRHFV